MTAVTVAGGQVQRSRIDGIEVVFDANVGTSLAPADIEVRNVDTGIPIASSLMTVAFDVDTYVATLSFPGLPGGQLPDGNYRVTVTATGIADVGGNPLQADATLDVSVLTGDANGDRVTNDVDLYQIWINPFMGGGDSADDLTGDGVVDGDDLDVVVGNYLAVLPPPAAPVPESAESGGVLPSMTTQAQVTETDGVAGMSIPGPAVSLQPYVTDPLYVFSTSTPGIDSQMRLSAFGVEDEIRLTVWTEDDDLDRK